MYFKSDLTPVKVVGIVCQLYFLLFSSLTLIVSLYVTIPSLRSLKDVVENSTIYHPSGLEVLFMFLFCFTIVNYIFLKYNAALSLFSFDEFKTPTRSPAVTTQGQINTATIQEFDKWSIIDVDDNIMISNEKDVYLNVNSAFSKSFLYSSETFKQNFKESKTGIAVNSNMELDENIDELYCNSLDSIGLISETNGIKTSSKVTIEWHFCRYCKKLVPPRTKHCPLCKFCVLKRDHHCFFANCCIGLHNQRYFITFCFYASLGTLFSMIATSVYLEQHYTQFQTWGYMSYLPPFIVYFWFFNCVNNFTLALLFFQYFNVITTLSCVYYFIIQIYLVCSGQTMYEYLKGIHTFRGNLWENIYSVFGRHWFVNFFIPTPSYGHESDAINWKGFINNKYL